MELVSIIIPKKRGENIEILLTSIGNQTYENIEVIVVDEGLERSQQRNIGIIRSKGEYLLFADSDWELSKYLVQECVNLMKRFDAIYIPETIVTKGLFAKIRNWERQFYTGTAIDVVRFVKAKDCPMFDEGMSGPEDSDWDRKIQGSRKICLSCYYHHDNVNFISYFKKKAYYSKSMKQFEYRNPNDKILNLKWRCWTVFMEGEKWRRFLSNPVLAICVIFTLGLRGIILKLNQR